MSSQEDFYHIKSIVSDTDVFMCYFPIPGYGTLPINAFLIRGKQPVLIDTGISLFQKSFLESILSSVNPEEINWLWLTHCDPDHIGNFKYIIELLPNARIITTYIGMGKLSLFQYRVDNVFLLNPGQSLYIGDRHLKCIKPPSFDAPETTSLIDTKTGACFSTDCFGAVLQEHAESASSIPKSQLRDGLLSWATADAPWLVNTDKAKFSKSLSNFKSLAPEMILSSHLPPAYGITDILLEYLSMIPETKPFQGPDQAELERLITES